MAKGLHPLGRGWGTLAWNPALLVLTPVMGEEGGFQSNPDAEEGSLIWTGDWPGWMGGPVGSSVTP